MTPGITTREKHRFARQLRDLRKSRQFNLASARFVRQHGLDDPLPYVQRAWLDHRAILATMRYRDSLLARKPEDAAPEGVA